MEPIYFSSPAEFRAWLEANFDKVEEQWVGFFKKHTGIPSMAWPESVDEALCFGWIDGLRKKVDEQRYKIRFTPRRPNSIWSKVNIEKMDALVAAGMVHPAGLKAFDKRSADRSKVYAYERETAELSPEFTAQIKANELAWEYFSEKLAAGYKRTSVYWVMRAKQAATRQRRLDILIQSCEEGKKIPSLRRKGE